jgi:hypothetical protein
MKTQKPSRTPHAVHNDKLLDSNIKSENDDDDNHPYGRHGKWPLTTHQMVLTGIVRSSYILLGVFLFITLSQLPPCLNLHYTTLTQPAAATTIFSEDHMLPSNTPTLHTPLHNHLNHGLLVIMKAASCSLRALLTTASRPLSLR